MICHTSRSKIEPISRFLENTSGMSNTNLHGKKKGHIGETKFVTKIAADQSQDLKEGNNRGDVSQHAKEDRTDSRRPMYCNRTHNISKGVTGATMSQQTGKRNTPPATQVSEHPFFEVLVNRYQPRCSSNSTASASSFSPTAELEADGFIPSNAQGARSRLMHGPVQSRRIWVREPGCKCISLISVSSCAVLLVVPRVKITSPKSSSSSSIQARTTPESSEVELWEVSRTMTKYKILPNSTLRLAELSHRLAPKTGSQTQIHLARRVHEP
jgi:hypothetical protein